MRRELAVGFAFGLGFVLAGVALAMAANLLRGFGSNGSRRRLI